MVYLIIALLSACSATPRALTEQERHLAWCHDIYEQNVGCPGFDKTVVPADVLARQESEHLAWCDRIYDQNVGCPGYGKTEVPAEVLALEEVKHAAWCERIENRNASCPHHEE